MTIPPWWPQIVRAADRRRHVTGLLLAHAVPTVHGGTLRLAFARADIVAAWRDSGAQAALEGALTHLGWEMPIEVANRPTAVGE